MNCDICKVTVSSIKNMAKHKNSEKCQYIKTIIDERETKHKNNSNLLNSMIHNLEEQNKLLQNQIVTLDTDNNNLRNKCEEYKNLLESFGRNSVEKSFNILSQSSSQSSSKSFCNNNNTIDIFKNLSGKNLVLNNTEVIYRKEDGFIDVTELCKAGGKRYNNWYQNDKTNMFLNVLSATTGIPVVILTKQEQGKNGERHTWAHPQVAINIAQWISPEFDVQVSKWILDLQKYNNELVYENQSIKKQNDEMTLQIKNKEKFNLFGNLYGKNLVLNNTEVVYRKEDGFINVSNLCKAGGKEFKAWNKNDKTKRFLEVLSSSVRILTDDLIKYESGSNNERATWAHPQVAINIAQWISPEFDVQVSKWIYELCVTGSVSLDTEKTTQEIDNILKEKYEQQLQELNKLQEEQDKYIKEINFLKESENRLSNELEEYKNKTLQNITDIQLYKENEYVLMNKLEETKNQLTLVKQQYENLMDYPLERHINEICDNFKLNDKIDNYTGYNCLYILYIDKKNETDLNGNTKTQYYLKFGESSNIENRLNTHKQKFKNLKIMWIIKTNNSNQTEREFREWLKKYEMLSKYETQTEIIKFENEEQLFNIKDKLNSFENEFNNTNYQILKFNHQNELNNEKINGLQEKIKCLENQIKIYEHFMKN